MEYDGKILASARERLDERRQHDKDEKARREREIYAKIPEIAAIDAELRRQMAKLMGLVLDRSGAEKLKALEDENLSLQARRAELLVSHGYPIDYLDDIIRCKKCRDTGVYNGGVCSCLEALYNRVLTEELSALLRTGDESFEHFELGLYPTAYDPRRGVYPRQWMAQVFETCRKYANNFSKKSPDLLFTGGTGLGKTYLSACIARVVADKGFSVCYDTVSSALDAFEVSRFARGTEAAEQAGVKIKRMLDCDLMILDDLGTEMATQVSVSALYTLVNSRLVSGKPMIISTNLTAEELSSRYTPQISSRILGEFLVLKFAGNDIRMMKKGV